MLAVDGDAEVAELGHPVQQRVGDQALLRIEFVGERQHLVTGERACLRHQLLALRRVPRRGQFGRRQVA